MTENVPFDETSLTRTQLVKRAGIGAGVLALTQLGVACGSSGSSSGKTIKIGFVSPRTGPAAGFGEGDPYVIGLAKKAFENGIDVGGTNYAVDIIPKDGQSDPQRGAQVANDLINNSKIDLMLTTSTPETTNPVCDASEAAGVPGISTGV